MSDSEMDCNAFDEWLLETEGADLEPWRPHLATCPGCRKQLRAHQLLVATFAEEAAPRLSPAFDAGLERKLAAAANVQPLRGWRLAVLAGYGLAALIALGWIFRAFPLPPLALPASPWVAVAACAAVPLTLWLTAAATRLLPSRRPQVARTFAF